MTDRDKIIKGLEQFKSDFKPFCGNGSDWARVDAAIALLKEQEEKIKNRNKSLEKAREEIKWLRGMLKGQEAVVRCKDCKFWNNDGIITTCEKHIGNGYPGDWFCADGERKNGND